MTDKVPREREQPGWWRPGERGLCLWCGRSFERSRVPPGVVMQACEDDGCRQRQREYEERLKGERVRRRMSREQRAALYDVEEVPDRARRRRLRRAVLEHGVEVVTAEAYL